MTTIRVISDVHNEFGVLDLPVLDTDKDSVLVLAGDIGLAGYSKTFSPFVEEMSKRFTDVIYIMGNHEYYKSSFRTARRKIKDELISYLQLQNVHVLENETVVINGVAFVCATLWSDFDKLDPLCMMKSQSGMNDFNIIRTGPNDFDEYQRKLVPSDVASAHFVSRDYIFGEVAKQKTVGNKVVVVTHHGPSYQSVPEMYRTGQYADMNGAYVSNLDDKVLETKPEIWIHGHTHTSFDYMIGDTRVIVNPRGYYGHEVNPEFNPTLVIEV